MDCLQVWGGAVTPKSPFEVSKDRGNKIGFYLCKKGQGRKQCHIVPLGSPGVVGSWLRTIPKCAMLKDRKSEDKCLKLSPNSSSSVAVSVAGVGDHDLPLFAISCIHKHLRSASSKPGCYTVLYFLFFDDLFFFFLRSFLLSTNALAFPFSSHGLEMLLVFF